MRTPLIAGNWKMNTTVEEAATLVSSMKEDLDRIEGVDKVVCPPFVSLASISSLLQGSTVRVGAQNMFYEEKGACTGEISPLMLKDLCQYVILGHSERRQYFGETDEVVNKKLRAALKAELIPIVCVGEKLEENEAGKTAEIVTRQVRGAFSDVTSPGPAIIAYEPIWAIGTGRAATSDQANSTIDIIRREVVNIYGSETAGSMRILYGGSVTSANIADLMCQPEIDGGLVGGASLKAAEFVSITRQAADAKRKR